jgi:hypothetical protein
MKKLFNITNVCLISIVILAAVLRIARMFQEMRYSTDVYLYFEMAANWTRYGVEYTYSYGHCSIPPLLLWLMAIGNQLGLTPEQTGLILGITLGSLMPLAAFGISFYLFSHLKDKPETLFPVPKTLSRCHVYALLAAFFVAVHPFLVRISVSCLREVLYLPLFAFAIFCAVSAIYNKSLWKWFLFALLVTLANMTRKEGIGLILIFFLWQAVEFIFDRENSRKNIVYHIKASVLVLSVFLGITLPVWYMLNSNACKWTPFIFSFK